MGKPIRHRGKWRIRWTDENGKRQSEVFAEHRDAVFQLRRHEHEVEEIRRGLKLGLPADKTFDDLCDYWVEKRVPLKVSGYHDASIIRAHLRPAFGPLRLRDISLEHIDQFKAERIHLSRKTVWNILTLLKAMMSYAVDLHVTGRESTSCTLVHANNGLHARCRRRADDELHRHGRRSTRAEQR